MSACVLKSVLAIMLLSELVISQKFDIRNGRSLVISVKGDITLPNKLFAHLPNLEAISLNDCDNCTLSSDVFLNLVHIRNISLARNWMKSLPNGVFKYQWKLTNLDLSFNNFVTLDQDLLQNARNLVIVRLSHNQLTTIPTQLFGGLFLLQEIYLDSNNLKLISHQSFQDTSLQVLHLQNNQLDFNDNSPVQRTFDSPFQYLPNLKELNLRNNSIKTFINDWKYLNTHLKSLDLSHNLMSVIDFDNTVWSDGITINVSHNKISTMIGNFAPIRIYATSTWILNHNPLNCDCMLMHLANYLRNASVDPKHLNLMSDEMTCATPAAFINKHLEEIPLNDLVCPLDHANAKQKHCPDPCTCFVRTYDSTVVFNCSNANLSTIPRLPDIKQLGLKHYELYIENNNITELPSANTTGYKSVNRIFAKNNSIDNIFPAQLPNDLFDLDLCGNQLHRMNPDVLLKLSHMPNLQNVSFGRNPWICDCDAYELLHFIENNFARVIGIEEITCENDISRTLINEHGLCPVDATIVLIILIAAIVAFLLLATTLYYKNKQEIMVWMFAHHGFSWLFKNKLNDEYIYDAFILYASDDADFVLKQLVPPIESGSKPMKLCLLERELKGGDIVPLEIAKSVEASRQTIVVLTPNFMDSFSNLPCGKTNGSDTDIWGLMGFRIAHKTALDQRRSRVVIITKGDIGSSQHFQSEMKAYLKTNVFLRWNEARFFDKLRLAIVHPQYFKTKYLPNVEQV